ncbi:MAG: FecCD family ABC transporter permease [Halomonas sp.]
MTSLVAKRPAAGQVGRLGASALAFVVLLLLAFSHLGLGARDVPLATLVEALMAYDPEQFEHFIIREMRLPRLLIAMVVGAALAVAGALMQGVTLNPLAAPDILGVNLGASLAVVLATAFGLGSLEALPWFAFGGALFTSLLVYLIGSLGRSGATPLKLTLAGVAVSAFLGAVMSAGHLLHEAGFERLRVWLAGTLAGRDMDVFVAALPYLALGFVLALLLARQVTALGLGADVARGLGIHTARLRTLALGCVVLLCGAAVTVTGPIGFIGLVVPHMVRTFAGLDYRWVVPLSALVGAAVLTAADIAARTLLAPQELATGIVTALVGAPIFVALVRWQVR